MSAGEETTEDPKGNCPKRSDAAISLVIWDDGGVEILEIEKPSVSFKSALSTSSQLIVVNSTDSGSRLNRNRRRRLPFGSVKEKKIAHLAGVIPHLSSQPSPTPLGPTAPAALLGVRARRRS